MEQVSWFFRVYPYFAKQYEDPNAMFNLVSDWKETISRLTDAEIKKSRSYCKLYSHYVPSAAEFIYAAKGLDKPNIAYANAINHSHSLATYLTCKKISNFYKQDMSAYTVINHFKAQYHLVCVRVLENKVTDEERLDYEIFEKDQYKNKLSDNPQDPIEYHEYRTIKAPEYAKILKTLEKTKLDNQRAKILMMEDDSIAVTVQSYLFADNECLCHNCEDPYFALQHANEFDIVVLDIGLPKVDGLEICKRIRSKFHTLPIVIVTAHKREEMEDKANEAGASAFYCKPLTQDNINEILNKYT